MATSGVCSASHARAGAYPSKSAFQFGSSILPRSIAAPIDGTCDVASPQITSAIAPASRPHRREAVRLAHAGEYTTQVLHRPAVHHRQLVDVEDAAAEVDHRLPVALQHGALLLVGQAERAAVGGLVGQEPLAVGLGPQAHEQLVHAEPAPAGLPVEDRRALEALGHDRSCGWVARASTCTSSHGAIGRDISASCSAAGSSASYRPMVALRPGTRHSRFITPAE